MVRSLYSVQWYYIFYSLLISFVCDAFVTWLYQRRNYMFSRCPFAAFVRSTRQVLLQRNLVNGLSNLDETYREYSLAPLMTWLHSGDKRSKVKVTQAVEVAKASLSTLARRSLSSSLYSVIMPAFVCDSKLILITGLPNGSVLFCTLSSVVVVCNARGRSAAAWPGAWPVRRPTLQGGTVRLRPVRATPCFVLMWVNSTTSNDLE